jgi:hypothetical protein
VTFCRANEVEVVERVIVDVVVDAVAIVVLTVVVVLVGAGCALGTVEFGNEGDDTVSVGRVGETVEVGVIVGGVEL